MNSLVFVWADGNWFLKQILFTTDKLSVQNYLLAYCYVLIIGMHFSVHFRFVQPVFFPSREPDILILRTRISLSMAVWGFTVTACLSLSDCFLKLSSIAIYRNCFCNIWSGLQRHFTSLIRVVWKQKRLSDVFNIYCVLYEKTTTNEQNLIDIYSVKVHWNDVVRSSEMYMLFSK